MTKTFQRALAGAAILSAILSLGWGDTEEQIRRAAETVETVRAGFVQEKHMKILARPLVSKGRFLYAAPGSLRWEYEAPVRSLLLMHGGDTARYRFEQDRWVRDTAFDLQAMQVVIEQIAGWLGGRFDENGLFSSRLIGRSVVLVPKSEGFARFVQRIELRLSDRPGVLDSIVLVEGEQTFTRIRFTDVSINVPTPSDRFQVPP